MTAKNVLLRLESKNESIHPQSTNELSIIFTTIVHTKRVMMVYILITSNNDIIIITRLHMHIMSINSYYDGSWILYTKKQEEARTNWHSYVQIVCKKSFFLIRIYKLFIRSRSEAYTKKGRGVRSTSQSTATPAIYNSARMVITIAYSIAIV